MQKRTENLTVSLKYNIKIAKANPSIQKITFNVKDYSYKSG